MTTAADGRRLDSLAKVISRMAALQQQTLTALRVLVHIAGCVAAESDCDCDSFAAPPMHTSPPIA